MFDIKKIKKIIIEALHQHVQLTYINVVNGNFWLLKETSTKSAEVSIA